MTLKKNLLYKINKLSFNSICFFQLTELMKSFTAGPRCVWESAWFNVRILPRPLGCSTWGVHLRSARKIGASHGKCSDAK